MAKPKKTAIPKSIKALRALPIDERAEAIIRLHMAAAREFAVMVLEYARKGDVKPPAKRKRRVRTS